jgi:hypothetical protein
MDEIVLRGMARWPNVPAVYGWLSLDRRGAWRIRGEPVSNPALSAYIGRNYAHDDEGRWYFQNGPQRVYVALDYTPLVCRIAGAAGAAPALETHDGRRVVTVSGAWMDENGALLLQTERGVALLHDRDLGLVFPCLIDANGNAFDETVLENLFGLLQQGQEAPLWLRLGEDNVRIGPIRSAEVPRRFGFVARPARPAEELTRR